MFPYRLLELVNGRERSDERISDGRLCHCSGDAFEQPVGVRRKRLALALDAAKDPTSLFELPR